MGSSHKVVNKILGMVIATQAEEFLPALANLRDDPKDCGKLLSKYPGVFHPSTSETAVVAYRKELRRAWDAHEQRTRDWYIYEIRRAHAALERLLETRDAVQQYSQHPFVIALNKFSSPLLQTPGQQQQAEKDWLDELASPPPEVTRLEAILVYFQTRIGDRAKHCGYADCPAPYFIAKKRWQKFCSEECAGPANRESKRRWWSDNRAVRS